MQNLVNNLSYFANNGRRKSKKRSSQQATLSQDASISKKRKSITKTAQKKRNSKSENQFNGQNVIFAKQHWDKCGGTSYWKQGNNFENIWKPWCKNALGVDRSSVSNANNERGMLNRFTTPESLMKHKNKGLKELQNDEGHWDEALKWGMIQQGMTFATTISNNGKRLTAKLTGESKNKALAVRRVLEGKNKNKNEGENDSDVECESDEETEQSEVSDSDITHIMSQPLAQKQQSKKQVQKHQKSKSQINISNIINDNGNNNDNDGIPPMISPGSSILPSLNSVSDALYDLSQVTGQNLNGLVNTEPLFNVKDSAVSALDGLKAKREEELAQEEQENDEKTLAVIGQVIDGILTTATDGSLQTALLAVTLGSSIKSQFFQWLQVNRDGIEQYFKSMDTFSHKLCNVIGDKDEFDVFLDCWMAWRVLFQSDIGLILNKIDGWFIGREEKEQLKQQSEFGLLPPPDIYIDDNNDQNVQNENENENVNENVNENENENNETESTVEVKSGKPDKQEIA